GDQIRPRINDPPAEFQEGRTISLDAAILQGAGREAQELSGLRLAKKGRVRGFHLYLRGRVSVLAARWRRIWGGARGRLVLLVPRFVGSCPTSPLLAFPFAEAQNRLLDGPGSKPLP